MGSEMNEGERLVKLETEVGAVKEAVFDMKKMLTNQHENYITKEVLDEKLKSLDKDVQGLQKAIDQIRLEKQSNKSNLPVWLGILPSIAAVVVAIIAIYK
ncbi:hypothetical protein BC351_10335 [Paenibacillus ferrarius]|uniref:Uncharacterized protein n=1 Tax=Paenibacillus ferrarius TaxID=1469647 RepID=A0A1V4H8V8_9BACL|nr:hypothetical protein [Paenibacillus ferrarius]OPH47581.1 hypothetical protein BC351_10335 [Paenibacillus ferrarius]